MQQIDQLLTAEGSPGSVVGEGAADKQLTKTEDKIVTLLHLVRRCLRGAAEILGDSGGERQEVEEGQAAGPLLGTGRVQVLQTLSPEDALYLDTLRHTTATFVNRVQSLLDQNTPSAPVSGPSAGVVALSPLGGYANSPAVRSALMKIVKVAVCQRMAVLKNVDTVKKWVSMSRRMTKSATSQYMEKKLQRIVYGMSLPEIYPPPAQRGEGVSWELALGTPEYWLGHDLCSRSVCDSVWIQHILRLKDLSYTSTNAELRQHGTTSPYLHSLRLTASACGHEYDAVRSQAQKVFQEVSSRFGWRIESVISVLLEQISTAGTSYATAAGALSILSLDLILKRIAGTWRLQEAFLRSLRAFPTMLVSVVESDKREKLSNKLSGLFSRYLGAWHHNPMRQWNGDGPAPASALVASYLADLGGIAGQEGDAGGASNTLRHQMYVASVVLTFIGHSDVTLPSGVWDWALASLRSDHGQPLQMVALSALTKLTCVLSQATAPPPAGVVESIRATLTTPTLCVSFLQGIAHCHKADGAGGDNAQWSKGIDTMFRNAEYLCNVLPRQSTAYSERCTFSTIFRSTNAFLLCQLLSILSDAVGTVPTDVVSAVLQASKDVQSTNEDEARAVNAARAEVCSGVMRFLVQREALGCPCTETTAAWQEVVMGLSDQTQRLSIDYCNDYAEGVAYGLGTRPNDPRNAVCAMILANAAETFGDGVTDEGSGVVTGGDSSGSGFTRYAKHLLLLRALLVTDISAVSSLTSPASGRSAIGETLHQMILDRLAYRMSSFASPYQVLRVEMSRLLATLAEYDVGFVPLGAIADKVMSECSGSRSNGNNSTGGSEMCVETPVDTSTSDSSSSEGAGDTWRLACDTTCRLLSSFLDSSLQARYANIACSLLACALEGCGHPEVEFSKHCHQVCLRCAQSLKNGGRSAEDIEESTGLLGDILNTFLSKATHSSLHVRETVILSVGVLLANNYPVMSVAEKKRCRDTFAQGFQDDKPEVQVCPCRGVY